MGRITRRRSGVCNIEVKNINGRVTMKCTNLNRKPTKKEAEGSAQALLDSVKAKKVIFK